MEPGRRLRQTTMGDDWIMEGWICPVCGDALTAGTNVYRCPKGHSFDRARSGYVNLLRGQTGGNHGDDREMLRARQRFLESGCYAFLRDGVAAVLAETALPKGMALDAGSGEGYYTEAIFRVMHERTCLALDISKDAVDMTAKRLHAAGIACETAVASVYKLPLANNSLACVTSIFSPLAVGEFRRVLCLEGVLAVVVPLERHLMGLKKVLYDTPYLNTPGMTEEDAPDGFVLEKRITLTSSFRLTAQDTIMDLFRMTPYYHRTPPDGRKRLESLNQLETEACFGLLVYRRKE